MIYNTRIKLRLIKKRHYLSIDNLRLAINEMEKLEIINLIIYRILFFSPIFGEFDENIKKMVLNLIRSKEL